MGTPDEKLEAATAAYERLRVAEEGAVAELEQLRSELEAIERSEQDVMQDNLVQAENLRRRIPKLERNVADLRTKGDAAHTSMVRAERLAKLEQLAALREEITADAERVADFADAFRAQLFDRLERHRNLVAQARDLDNSLGRHHPSNIGTIFSAIRVSEDVRSPTSSYDILAEAGAALRAVRIGQLSRQREDEHQLRVIATAERVRVKEEQAQRSWEKARGANDLVKAV